MIVVEPILSLRDLAPAAATIRFESVASFAELRGILKAECPGLYEGVFGPDGTLRDSVLLFVNQEKVGADEIECLVLADGDRVSLVPAIVGG